MISTPTSSTSDYYSSSDIDYDDDHQDGVKAAPQHHWSTNTKNEILKTLLHHDYHRSSSNISSTIRVQHSIRLLKLGQQYHLSNEVFIRANVILHQFLHSTCSADVDESILVACLSLSTKLSQHSTHPSMTCFSSNTLLSNENRICNAVDWDIDMMTPINYVEVTLCHVIDGSMRNRLREMTYELIVRCLTDVRCVDFSSVSLGMSCLLMACELLKCGEILPNEVFRYDQEKNSLFETSLIYIRHVLINILCR